MFRKRLFTLILAAALTLSAFPASIAADAPVFTDVSGHWGAEHLTRLIEEGIIVGDGRGRAMPDRRITDYEADIMLGKAIGNGHGTGRSAIFNTALPRESALRWIFDFFQFPDALPSFRSEFTDFVLASDWAKASILALEYAGIISGRGGKIAPKDTITRAEFAALLSKAVCAFIDEDADFKDAELERVIIRRPGITVKNLTAECVIIAADGTTFEGCDLGTVFSRSFSAYLINTNITELITPRADRIASGDDSVIEQTRPH
jgi:hypothetical protein